MQDIFEVLFELKFYSRVTIVKPVSYLTIMFLNNYLSSLPVISLYLTLILIQTAEEGVMTLEMFVNMTRDPGKIVLASGSPTWGCLHDPNGASAYGYFKCVTHLILKKYMKHYIFSKTSKIEHRTDHVFCLKTTFHQLQ